MRREGDETHGLVWDYFCDGFESVGILNLDPVLNMRQTRVSMKDNIIFTLVGLLLREVRGPGYYSR